MFPTTDLPGRRNVAHRVRMLMLGAGLAVAAPRAPLDAQVAPPRDSTSTATSLDSLAARLARTEEALRLLREQLATESAAQVRLRSRAQLELSARLVMNSFRSSGNLQGGESPVFASPDRARDPEYGSAGRSNLGASFRQTLIGATATIDSVLGGTLAADLEVDFFARATDANPPLFPEPRLRTARVFLTRPKTDIMLGTETPLISDLNPISSAGVGIPVFATAGNLWNWLPQLRVTREVWSRAGARAVSVALQGALMAPYANERHLANLTGPDAAALTGKPAVESRVRVRWGTEHDVVAAQGVHTRGGEIGVGVHSGALRVAGDSSLHSWAVSTDLRVPLGTRVELRGEGYRGRLIRGLGGGAIGQNFGTLGVSEQPGVPLTDTAGWLQLNAQMTPMLIAGGGCGTDRVHERAVDRRRNTACAVHTQWRPTQPLFISFEWREFRTRYNSGLARGRQLNLGLGIEL
ncbi:MAG: hypothetical protein K2R93_05225 [Gemmatimonadaceae bacterium]|nr:hypothetical protein [Gemmatimonadaceae bacterium]